jgi:hypothetical protein
MLIGSGSELRFSHLDTSKYVRLGTEKPFMENDSSSGQECMLKN